MAPLLCNASLVTRPTFCAPRRCASGQPSLLAPPRWGGRGASGSLVLTAKVLVANRSHVCSSIKWQARDALDAIDGQLKRRMTALDKLYGKISLEAIDEVLADDFAMSEMGHARRFTKEDYKRVMANTLAAVPDFNWGAASTGEVDDNGYAIVVVTASGHHTGSELRVPGLEPLPASGKHFALAEEVHKVKTDALHGKVKEIVVLPNKGAGPRAMYAALGGRLPEPLTAPNPDAGEVPMP